MPSTSPKQARFMDAAAHSPQFAKQAGISMGVAKEFNEADKAKKSAQPHVGERKTETPKARGGYPAKSNTPTAGGYRGKTRG